MEKKKINIKEIYSQNVFEYLKPSFPSLTDAQIWDKVSFFHVMTEPFLVIMNTIKQVADMAIEETSKNGMDYHNSTNYIVKKQLEAEMLKTKEQIVMGKKYVRCYDRFDVELHDGDVVDVQSVKGVLVYGNDLDGQLYFKPYGEEERVSSYLKNDLEKQM